MEEVELPFSVGKMAAALAISLVDRAYCLGAVTDGHRQKLLQKLRSVQDVWDRCERRLIEGNLPLRRILFQNLSQRIWQFRGFVEEIEDAFDEIDYRRLEEEVGNPISKFVKRNIINKVTRLDIPRSNLKRLRNALDNLHVVNVIGNIFSVFVSLPTARERYPSWLATAGGDLDWYRTKEHIVQWLIKDRAEGNPLSVCALVGMAGTGKSTFASIVRQDPRVSINFDFIVWCSVSVDFNVRAMAENMLQSITGVSPTYYNMRSPKNLLEEQLRDKKLLLILDDVKEYDSVDKWKTLVAPLKACKKGSRILLTTQMQPVVDMAENVIGAAAELMLLKRQLPSQVDSEGYPESALSSVPFSSLEHNRYPSWISNGCMFGRDRQTEQIVQWLTMDTAEDNPVSVYAVVGMAGMGKTTLANIVSQDPRVPANFKAVVWVPVSVDFDTEAMTRVILESITGRPPGYSSMYLLQNSLTETLRYRKVLLILDDVWEDSSVKWETFVAPLRVCKKGSRILLTTRMQSVVDMAASAIGAQAKYLKLDELNENDNLMLFKSRLPSQVDSQDYNSHLLIGEQIVKKIGGCPLVTSLVASWLGSHMDTHHWITVLQKGWQHLEEKYIVLASLRLSYDCLPTELQTCFRYCSLFPKGYKFNKVELAKMWTGSGLIPFSSLKQENIGLQKTKYVDLLSAEDVGEEYFNALARKSFFCMLETEPSDGDQKEYYVLHDLMHDLAQHVSEHECARVDSGDLRNVSGVTRHLSIAHCSGLEAIHCNPCNVNLRLQTLIIKIEFALDQEAELLLGKFLKSCRRLRLLYLGVPSLFHVLDSVPSLTHLRYLFLFSCDESHLQKVFELYHLQVFKLEYLTGKGANCTDIHNLRRLRCLHVPDNMSSKIHQIGKLTSLQELHGFEVVENDGQRLSALGNLRSLCQLSLRNLQNISNIKEAMEIKLKGKYHMKFLSLSWNVHLNEPVNQDDRVINNLEPNKEIERLHIHGYNGVKIPVWIENSTLIRLVSLELEYCMKWKSLPSLQELSLLKHLKLENLFQLEYIGTVLEEQFETNKSENAWLPPFLSTLTIRWCPNLKELPAIPCTLKLLIIKHVQLSVLPRICQSYTGGWESAPVKAQLVHLHIESCACLTSLDEGLLEQQDQFHFLTSLVVRHCERLRHLPRRGFTELHHLNSLEIVACPILRDIKAEGRRLLPTSLKNLELNPCGDIEVSNLTSLQNLTTLRSLALFNCSNIEKLPSVEVFGTMNNLNDVSIARCKNLLSLGGLGSAASLRVLSILCCDKLNSSSSTQNGCSFKLQKLRIDRGTLLSVEPLWSLTHTKELHVCDDYAMESLPGEWLLQNAASLHSIEIGVAEALCYLPSEVEKLESLQSLHIERAPLIKSLPLLPASLIKLTIWGCDPKFLKCYERNVGSDWGKIAHIAIVDIKAYSEGMNYSDHQSQDFMNSTSNPYRQFVVID